MELADPLLHLPLIFSRRAAPVRNCRSTVSIRECPSGCRKPRASLLTGGCPRISQVCWIGEALSLQKPQPKSRQQGRSLCPLSWNEGLETHHKLWKGGWGHGKWSMRTCLSFREPGLFPSHFYIFAQTTPSLELSPAPIPFLLEEIQRIFHSLIKNSSAQ